VPCCGVAPMRSEGKRFEALRERLLVGGISPRRVKRYLAELNDHLAELTARECAAGYGPAEAAARARTALGSEDELAQSWLSNPRLKSFTARAPWAMLPAQLAMLVGLGFAMWILVSMGVARLVKLLNTHGVMPQDRFDELSALLSQSASFVTAPLVALVIALLVRRQRLSPYWTFLPVVVLLAAAPRFHITISAHDASVGAGLVDITSSADHGLPVFSSLVLALQVALTLAPTLWLLARQYVRTNGR
jgi:hypothetical protein